MIKNFFMQAAYAEAVAAYESNEVPVGCVIVDDRGVVVSRCHNLVESKSNSTQHAEIIAINDACNKLKAKYLEHCSIYISLEPCIMCAAALDNVRISAIYYGALNEKFGAIESIYKFFTSSLSKSSPEIYPLMSNEFSDLMKNFFFSLRSKE